MEKEKKYKEYLKRYEGYNCKPEYLKGYESYNYKPLSFDEWLVEIQGFN